MSWSAYVSGRYGSKAITPLRASTPDRKLPRSLTQDERALATALSAKNRKSGAPAIAGKESAPAVSTDSVKQRPEANEANQRELRAAREARREEIKKLEQIRAQALYPAPATAKERSLAQLAHTQIVRAEAELRAQELEEARQHLHDQSAARFRAEQAAETYRQLELFG